MMHFNGDEYAAWAFMVLIGAGCILAVVIADHTEIGRRARQAGHLLAEAGPWLVGAVLDVLARQPGFTVPASHPAARAVSVRGWGHLTDEEALEFDGITALLKAGVLADEPQSRREG